MRRRLSESIDRYGSYTRKTATVFFQERMILELETCAKQTAVCNAGLLEADLSPRNNGTTV